MNSPLALIYEIRDKLVGIYQRYTVIFKIITKFILAFLMLKCINANAGYLSTFSKMPVMAGIAALCSLLSMGMISFVMSMILLLEYAKLSLVVCAVAGCLILVMILLQIIFAPGCGGILFLIPLAFYLKIPFLLPLALGLTAPVVSVIPVAFGTGLYYFMKYVSASAGVLTNSEASMIDSFKTLVTGMQSNKFMFMVILALCTTLIVVYLVHRLSLDHSWTIAVGLGAVLDAALMLFGIANSSNADMNASYVIVYSIVSVLIAYLIQFMIFAVDYKRTEHTQFEDDDYYYYVKAVPKVKVAGRVAKKTIDIVAEEPVEEASVEAEPFGAEPAYEDRYAEEPEAEIMTDVQEATVVIVEEEE